VNDRFSKDILPGVSHDDGTTGSVPSMVKKQQGGSSRRPKSDQPSDDAFRSWLERQLHKKYDDILEEPIPDDLLALLGTPKPEQPEH
jgi:hypothetical protein